MLADWQADISRQLGFRQCPYHLLLLLLGVLCSLLFTPFGDICCRHLLLRKRLHLLLLLLLLLRGHCKRVAACPCGSCPLHIHSSQAPPGPAHEAGGQVAPVAAQQQQLIARLCQ